MLTKEPFGVRKFKEKDMLRTNDAILFADTIMELSKRGVIIKPSKAEGYKYCIIRA